MGTFWTTSVGSKQWTAPKRDSSDASAGPATTLEALRVRRPSMQQALDHRIGQPTAAASARNMHDLKDIHTRIKQLTDETKGLTSRARSATEPTPTSSSAASTPVSRARSATSYLDNAYAPRTPRRTDFQAMASATMSPPSPSPFNKWLAGQNSGVDPLQGRPVNFDEGDPDLETMLEAGRKAQLRGLAPEVRTSEQEVPCTPSRHLSDKIFGEDPFSASSGLDMSNVEPVPMAAQEEPTPASGLPQGTDPRSAFLHYQAKLQQPLPQRQPFSSPSPHAAPSIPLTVPTPDPAFAAHQFPKMPEPHPDAQQLHQLQQMRYALANNARAAAPVFQQPRAFQQSVPSMMHVPPRAGVRPSFATAMPAGPGAVRPMYGY